MDLLSAYVVATLPAGPPDTTPPSVSVTQPTAGAVVTGPITLTADATDIGGSGMKNVVFRLDNAASRSILGTVTSLTSTYSMLWNPAGTSNGGHTIYAAATDNANNSQASAGVGIKLNLAIPPPTVSIAVSSSPLKKGTSIISATATPGGPSVTITKVEFYINNNLAGTDADSPYSFSWKTAAGKTYTVFARAYDSVGQVTQSGTLAFKP